MMWEGDHKWSIFKNLVVGGRELFGFIVSSLTWRNWGIPRTISGFTCGCPKRYRYNNPLGETRLWLYVFAHTSREHTHSWKRLYIPDTS